MTLLKEQDLQRFVFTDVDWTFYEDVCRRLDGRRVFVTYYRGKLEVVTTSYLHEQIAFLLYRLVCELAEAARTPMKTVGRSTLREQVLDEGVEADTAFYFNENAMRMRGKRKIDLKIHPPPDLAIEVEVTRRLAARKLIYRDMGVPEVWRYADDAVTVLVRQGEDYVRSGRSPTFPFFSPEAMAALVRAGIGADETAWIVAARRQVRDELKRHAGKARGRAPRKPAR